MSVGRLVWLASAARQRLAHLSLRSRILCAATTLLVVVMLVAGYSSKDYLAVDIDKLSSAQGHFVTHGSETYLLFRLSDSQQGYRGEVLSPRRRIGDVLDPPRRHQQVGSYRVFSLREYLGVKMLPGKKWWDLTVPCSNLAVVSERFEHPKGEMDGGIVCHHSMSPWWEREMTYDLQGYSQSHRLASLYVPRYHVYDDEIHIGLNHSH